MKPTVSAGLFALLSVFSLALPPSALCGPVNGVIPQTPVSHTVRAPLSAAQSSAPAPAAAPVHAVVRTNPLPGVIDPLQPIDVSKQNLFPQLPSQDQGVLDAMSGVMIVSRDDYFKTDLSGANKADFLVRAEDDASFKLNDDGSIQVQSGTVYIASRKRNVPLVIKTAAGAVAVRGSADLLVSNNDGVLRVANISARGTHCRLALNESIIGHQSGPMALAAGYEVVAASRPLLRGEFRPADNIGRRGAASMAGGRIVVNEFSTESFVSGSKIIAAMTGETRTAQQQQVLATLPKYAAAIDYLNGSDGYTVEPGTLTASK
jgi:hypothetical protein